jgi:hypothetical protein
VPVIGPEIVTRAGPLTVSAWPFTSIDPEIVYCPWGPENVWSAVRVSGRSITGTSAGSAEGWTSALSPAASPIALPLSW